MEFPASIRHMEAMNYVYDREVYPTTGGTMRHRFGFEKDFQTNMEYRHYITDVHFEWKCPACGVEFGSYHMEGCPIERKDEDVSTKINVENRG